MIILYYINNYDFKKTNPRDIELKRNKTLMMVGGYYQLSHVEQDINEVVNWYKIHPNYSIMQHRPTFEKEEAISVLQLYVRR